VPTLIRSVRTILSASIVSMTLLIAGAGFVAAAPDCYVPSGEYPTIFSALNDHTCSTIYVAEGVYPEHVDVDRTVTLIGAQANVDPAARTAGDPTESSVLSFTVREENVTINGFSVTVGSPSRNGIIVKTPGSGSLVTFNVIEDIGSLSFTGTERDNAVGVYLELGPDNVDVVRNKMSRIFSTNGSAQGVLVGDSSSGDPSLDVLIAGNIVEGLQSVFRGAYGIQINNGASTAETATGHTTGVVRDNRIDGLTGSWAHGVGLEGPTPGLAVLRNNISNLTDVNPTAFNDVFGVLVQSNPHWGQIQINENNFVLENMAEHGIGVDPSTPGTGMVDGTCNWWNASNGPGPVGPGSGALVTANVDYSPWLVSPDGPCSGFVPTNSDECRDGGWETAVRDDGTSFKNQGDCVSYLNSGK